MAETLPSVSTDQVAAFVELADHKSLRAAAAGLHITEQGLRNRLIALETQLKVPLYHKQRGPRRRSPLTPQGEQFLPQAKSFLESARRLGGSAGVHQPKQGDVANLQFLKLFDMRTTLLPVHPPLPPTPFPFRSLTER